MVGRVFFTTVPQAVSLQDLAGMGSKQALAAALKKTMENVQLRGA